MFQPMFVYLLLDKTVARLKQNRVFKIEREKSQTL